jgi:hypothetical protein
LSAQPQFDALLHALYKDSRLKNRLILLTFLGLVVPLSLMVAMGFPEKPACLVMIALFPLLFLTNARNIQRKATSVAGFDGIYDPSQKEPGTTDPQKELENALKELESTKMLVKSLGRPKPQRTQHKEQPSQMEEQRRREAN